MVITRFAPSPTGPFHIGNARTALFNFLLARQQGGRFILRIEDTDRQRSDKKHEEAIVKGLRWLGLDFDGEIVHQTSRLAIYTKYLEDLKLEGLAYEQGGAIYFRAAAFRDQMESVVFHDLIRGKISTPLKVIDDFVIVKSDGTPLFLLTNIIDDVELKVTHVIRGEDHISNTPRQLLIAQALELTPPQYAHAPIILAADRSKLSKRHGAVSLDEYQAQGYLPEAIINFLALLGWHPSEKSEIRNPRLRRGFGGQAKSEKNEYFALAELVKEFSLERVQKSGAVFDIEKLNSLNRHYIRQLAPDQLIERVKSFSAQGPNEPVYLANIATLIKDRLTRLVEFDSETLYFFADPTYEPQLLIFKSSDKTKTTTGLRLAISELEISNLETWSSFETLQHLLSKIVEKNHLANGDVFWPVRVALSGKEQSPGPHELLWAMGRERSLIRLRRALEKLSIS